jgi:hypothetical protein
MMSWSKKNPPAFVGPAGVGTVLCLLSYATIAHTPGLRIRFVRFRQTVVCVVVIVTIAEQYNGESALASNSRRLANSELRTANRESRESRESLPPIRLRQNPTP